MSRFSKTALVIGASLALVGSLVAPLLVSAADQAPNGGQGLEISPPVIELKGDPGQTVTTQIRVRNVTKNALIAKVKTDDIEASGEAGQAKVLINDTGQSRFSLKTWAQTSSEAQIAPGELKTFNVAFVIPKNAEPGGHYGVVRFTAVPANANGTGVVLSASLGSLIFLTVSGSINHELNFKSFETLHKNQVGSFFDAGPIDLTQRMINEGTVHERPVGTVHIKSMFGKEIAALPFNDKGGNILPGSTRRFQQSLNKKALFGLYTAKLDVVYGDGKQLSRTAHFWVVPLRLLILVIAILVGIWFLLRYALKRYTANVLKRAGRR